MLHPFLSLQEKAITESNAYRCDKNTKAMWEADLRAFIRYLRDVTSISKSNDEQEPITQSNGEALTESNDEQEKPATVISFYEPDWILICIHKSANIRSYHEPRWQWNNYR